MRVAALQLNSNADVSANLDVVEELVARAVAESAALVMLPENFAFLGPEAQKLEIAEPLIGSSEYEPLAHPIQTRMVELARRHQVHLLLGGFPERAPAAEAEQETPDSESSPPFNTSALLGPDGRLAAYYRKLHLFDIDLPDGTSLRESRATQAGDRVVVTEVLGLRLGLSVCYDLRFPELYRRQVEQGANVISVPAAFTAQTGSAHWHVLLRARAIENQCWVVAPAQWGKHPEGRASYGHALIIDPWGQIVAEASDGVGVVLADLDLDQLARVRAGLPCLQHRKLK
ncbi:MAG: carbon-nitrogen hydrolase family protein [Myxococcales bacterium]|nr:carbon-nitrogen hydrolase family protein [Myxococcales bacterium]